MSNKDMRTYKYDIPIILGVTDLLGVHAWIGSSQGDSSVSNDVNGDHSWLMFTFGNVDETDQQAIDEEVRRRHVANDSYIADLKRKGEYAREIPREISIGLIHDPLFDTPLFDTPLFNNNDKIIK